ncbi:MAG: molybdenum ABC transporter ATP-binding protein [Alphaproteobacteria bacterium]|nr:MAG: molybdenum ABC transporter ATP-binding protein [Alphaproteobacteria bacterium]
MVETLSVRLARRFGDFALDAAFALPLSGITVVFGPSGCGKSTLLRGIAGLDREARGEVRLGGEIWLDSAARIFVPAHRRGAGLVFQDARLFDHLDVAGNLAFADRRSRGQGGGSGLDVDRDGVIAALDLAPLLPRRPARLSGGERQRVALGRALLSRPRLLLLDEPLSALDRARKIGILPRLAAVPERFGIPVVMVTHAIEEAVQLADRMVVLEGGRVIATGETIEVLARPEIYPLTGRFEAGVLIEARVEEHRPGDALTRLSVAGQELVMPMLEGLAPGQPVRLRIRARDVALALSPPRDSSIRNILRVAIVGIEAGDEGAFAELMLDLGGQRLRARITRASLRDLGLGPGMEVFALIKSVSFDRRWIAGNPAQS